MTENKINIKGLSIFYKVFGEGKPLLILHGWGSKNDKWQTTAKLLTGKGFQVIVPDLPGFGQSDDPDKIWDFDDYSNFTNDFINGLDLRKLSLLGHSFGGSIAIKYATEHPKKISKLYLVGAAAIREKSLKKKMIYVIAKTFGFFSFIPFLKRIFYKIIKTDYPHTQGIMRKTYLKVIKKDLSDLLNNINVPTIIIWGEEDPVTPLKHAYLINSKIKNSKLEIIPKMGHNLHSECPGMLANEVSKE